MISPAEQARLLSESPFEAYTYAYPHKMAYRPISPTLKLIDIWREEPRQPLFVYFHVPFCEMRCGFCNLFTCANPDAQLSRRYLDALRRQTQATLAALPDAPFARLAIGGGTPTFLEIKELENLFAIIESCVGAKTQCIPFSVETSPATTSCEKLALLRERGVNRISLGVQSFVVREVAAAGRTQKRQIVDVALQRIRDARFSTLNIDLIYGLPRQTKETWMESLHNALEWQPEELFLYPLYVRPETGLGRTGKEWADKRLLFYRMARELLLSRGYTQCSMRMFQSPQVSNSEGPAYCAQEDGMVGLGCGARSYTRTLQYATTYATSAGGVRQILDAYCSRSLDSFSEVDYGFMLDGDEQRRRYIALWLGP